MGIRGIIVAALASKEQRDFLASEARQRAALHRLPPFAVLVLDGASRRPIACPLMAIFECSPATRSRSSATRRRSCSTPPRSSCRPRRPDLVRVRGGALRGAEGRWLGAAGLAGSRRRHLEAGSSASATARSRRPDRRPRALRLTALGDALDGERSLVCPDPERDDRALGRRALGARGAGRATSICLWGDLGAGKTPSPRASARGLGVDATITLAQLRPHGRVRRPAAAVPHRPVPAGGRARRPSPAACSTTASRAGVTLVEWPDRLGDALAGRPPRRPDRRVGRRAADDPAPRRRRPGAAAVPRGRRMTRPIARTAAGRPSSPSIRATTQVVVASGSPDGAIDGLTDLAGRLPARRDRSLPTVQRFLGEQNIRRSRLIGDRRRDRPGRVHRPARRPGHGQGPRARARLPIVGVSTADALLAAPRRCPARPPCLLLLPAGPSDRIAGPGRRRPALLPGRRRAGARRRRDGSWPSTSTGEPTRPRSRSGEAARAGLARPLLRLGAARLAAGDADDLARARAGVRDAARAAIERRERGGGVVARPPVRVSIEPMRLERPAERPRHRAGELQRAVAGRRVSQRARDEPARELPRRARRR